MNTLYYGDNLKVLREHIKDASVESRLAGAEVKVPPTPKGSEAFKKAEKAEEVGPRQGKLGI